MSEMFLHALMQKTAIALAHSWVWGMWFINQKLPTWVEISVYEKDIAIQPLVGKKIKIRMEVVDDDSGTF
jgi:hypothetical protein